MRPFPAKAPAAAPTPLAAPSPLAKRDLMRTTQLAAQSAGRFWHPGTGGNFSVRDEGDLCWVSPSGKHKGELRWQDFLPANYQTALLVQPCYTKPSDETDLHCAVYRADPTARAVMHVHPAHAVALIRSSTPFVLSDNEMIKAFGYKTHELEVTVPCVPNTQDMLALGRAVALNLDLKILVLENHGVYAWGKTPDEAMYRIEALEFLCQLRSLSARS